MSGSYEKLSELFDRIYLFRGLRRTQLPVLQSVLKGRERLIETKGVYLQGGETVRRIGIVLSGELLQCMQAESGELRAVQNLLPGYLVNVSAVCSPRQHNPYYIYAPAGALIYEFSYQNLMNGAFPEEKMRTRMLRNLIERLASENIRSQHVVGMLSEYGLRARILVYLELCAQKFGSASFTIPFNRDEMAAYLSVNRSALSHELSLMRDEGLINFRKNRFELLKGLTDV